MEKDVVYILKRGTKLSEEEVYMIESAKNIDPVYDEDNPEIDPVLTPGQYKALMRAAAERNRRVVEQQQRTREYPEDVAMQAEKGESIT